MCVLRYTQCNYFSFSLALCLFSGTAWFKPVPPATDRHARDIAYLDVYAKERWEVGNMRWSSMISCLQFSKALLYLLCDVLASCSPKIIFVEVNYKVEHPYETVLHANFGSERKTALAGKYAT